MDAWLKERIDQVLPRVLRTLFTETQFSESRVHRDLEERLGLGSGVIKKHYREYVDKSVKTQVAEESKKRRFFIDPCEESAEQLQPPSKRRRADDQSACSSRWRALWDTREYTDFIVCCGSQTFDVHRAVLSGQSVVFKAMLISGGFKESAENQWVISDCEPKTVESFLEYIYTTEVTGEADWAALLDMANRYEIKGLLRLCADKLVSGLSSETVAASVRTLRLYKSHEECREAYKNMLKMVHMDLAFVEQLCDAV